jgi:hypothetical protein
VGCRSEYEIKTISKWQTFSTPRRSCNRPSCFVASVGLASSHLSFIRRTRLFIHLYQATINIQHSAAITLLKKSGKSYDGIIELEHFLTANMPRKPKDDETEEYFDVQYGSGSVTFSHRLRTFEGTNNLINDLIEFCDEEGDTAMSNDISLILKLPQQE